MVPLITPCISVIVTAEYGHETGCGYEGAHEGCVLAAVGTIGGFCSSIVGTPTLRLWSENVVVVDAGLSMWMDAVFGL